MANNVHSTWNVFRLLCRVLGGKDQGALAECVELGLTPVLFELARQDDILPALAVRCEQEGGIFTSDLAVHQSEFLAQALRENTLRNMQISAQARKLTKKLNDAGIVPLFLKGTIELLNAETKNLGFRKQVDIDILVEPGQLNAAAEVFLSDGYHFYEVSGAPTSKANLISDTKTAFRRSAAHHHLTPLVKPGYAATVELHRHHLPKRFQSGNPLAPLFAKAIQKENNGVTYQIPSVEHQLIHLILGKFVHDGHSIRHTFPLREACDYVHLMENADDGIDCSLVAAHCGEHYLLFSKLVEKLMNYSAMTACGEQVNVGQHMKVMQRRYNSRAYSALLDVYARAVHLIVSLIHSPGKLPGYLHRLGRE